MKRYIFALFCSISITIVIFNVPVAKAQNDSANYFDAVFNAQTIPGTPVTIENNLADPDTVRTEIDIWEDDLGKQATDASYVGPIFEASLFEIDYKPLQINTSYSTNTAVGIIGSGKFTAADLPDPLLQGWPFYIYKEYKNWTTNIQIPQFRSAILISQVVRFTPRMIMSGATSFWVKIPIHPSCINFDEKVPRFIMMDAGDNPDLEQFTLEDGYQLFYRLHPYETKYYENGTWYEEPEPVGGIKKEFESYTGFTGLYNGVEAQIISEPTTITEDSIYCRVHATVEPNTDYIMSFAANLKSEPQIYLTEEDVCSNGRYSMISVNDMEYFVTGENNVIEWGPDGVRHPIYRMSAFGTQVPWYGAIDPTSYVPFINDTESLPCDMAWSFIFDEGRGDYGMFGKKLHFDKYDCLEFYKNISELNMDGFWEEAESQYISIMVPFTSDQSITVRATVMFEPMRVASLGEHNGHCFEPQLVPEPQFTSGEGYIYPRWWTMPTNITYTDFILFSVPYHPWDVYNSPPIYHNQLRIIIRFEEATDITLLFSTLSLQDFEKRALVTLPMNTMAVPKWVDTWGNYELTEVPSSLSYIHRDIPLIQMPLQTQPFSNSYNATNSSYYAFKPFIMPKHSGESTTLHYFLQSSVQLTNGIWHELVHTTSGIYYATHFFERRMAIGVIDLFVDTTNRSAQFTAQTDYWSQAWNALTRGDILGAIANGVMGVISVIWNGLQTFLGVITGVFKAVWDGIKLVGSFVYNVLASFVGQILSIIGDIIGALESILGIALYIIAILIFMYIIAWSGKLLYLSRLYV